MTELTVDLGPFKDAVSFAVAAMAAATSLLASWRGKLGWQPFDQELPQASDKVAGVVGAVCISVLWIFGRGPAYQGLVAAIALLLAALFVLLFLAYVYLLSSRTYPVPPERAPRGTRLVGGFKLTPDAQDRMTNQHVPSVEQFLKGSDYRADLVWTAGSRGAVKLALTTTYLGLIVCGTVAVAAVGILGSTRLASAGR